MVYICYRSFERTTPIHFEKLVLDGTQHAEDYLAAKAEMISLATSHSLADIIPMGLCINSRQLAGHMDYFRNHLTGMSPRLPEIYSTYRLFAHEVIHAHVIHLLDDILLCSLAGGTGALQSEQGARSKEVARRDGEGKREDGRGEEEKQGSKGDPGEESP